MSKKNTKILFSMNFHDFDESEKHRKNFNEFSLFKWVRKATTEFNEFSPKLISAQCFGCSGHLAEMRQIQFAGGRWNLFSGERWRKCFSLSQEILNGSVEASYAGMHCYWIINFLFFIAGPIYPKCAHQCLIHIFWWSIKVGFRFLTKKAFDH